MTERPEIPEDTDPAALSAACANALRAWTTNANSIIGPVEVRHILFAEALSLAQAHLAPDQIAALLREMSRRIEAGELSTTLQ